MTLVYVLEYLCGSSRNRLPCSNARWRFEHFDCRVTQIQVTETLFPCVSLRPMSGSIDPPSHLRVGDSCGTSVSRSGQLPRRERSEQVSERELEKISVSDLPPPPGLAAGLGFSRTRNHRGMQKTRLGFAPCSGVRPWPAIPPALFSFCYISLWPVEKRDAW